MDKADVIVIGGGVIGLAVARAFAKSGRDVHVLEQHEHLAMETSSRNSEVIHAGLYYTPGSLKARMCVAGNKRLYRYCTERNISFKKSGKLIVAQTENEIADLKKLMSNAHTCGVSDLTLLTQHDVAQIEPALRCQAACLSPSTGVIDSHGLALALETDVTALGGTIVVATRVTSLQQVGDEIRVETREQGGQSYSLNARTVINAAGHGARALSESIIGNDTIPDTFYGKGHYYDYAGTAPFGHLIYPMPSPGALGIHLTRSTEDHTRFGPDLEWVAQPDYTFEDPNDTRKLQFVQSIQRYWPDLDPDKLHPGTTGVRPKVAGPGQPAADFSVQGPRDHGAKGYITLYGIESPGLTASLALADEVCRMSKNAAC